jgi:hypothetical protein
MKDAPDLSAGLGDGCSVVDIGLDKIHGLQAAQVFALAGGKIIDAAHALTPPQQLRCNRPTDEPGRASN